MRVPNLSDFYNAMVVLCDMENPYALYTMNTDSSLGPTRYGDTDSAGNIYFDCSSIISYCLYQTGFLGWNPWFTTYDMATYLLQAGFQEFDPNAQDWANGDILVRHTSYAPNPTEHTEVVHDADAHATMGAHSNSYPEPEQVSIRTFSSAGQWQVGYRWPEGFVPSPSNPWTPENFPNGWTHFTEWPWHYRNEPYGFEMSSVEAQDNARNVFTYCWQLGWTRYAICALLGNMQAECGLNPGLHEIGGTGYGLVQWTPESVFDAVMTAVYGTYTAADRTDGHRQMMCIFAEYMQTNLAQGHPWSRDSGCERQWYNSTGSLYGFSLTAIDWYDWAHMDMAQSDEASVDDLLEELTLQFMVSYLRPSYDASVNHWEQRVQFAKDWYSFFQGFVPPSPSGPGERRGMPLWMMLHWW